MKNFAKKGDSAKYKERRCHVLAVNNGFARIRYDGKEDIVRLCDLKNVKEHHSIKGVVRHG